jgi:hypothetical protein
MKIVLLLPRFPTVPTASIDTIRSSRSGRLVSRQVTGWQQLYLQLL